MAQSGKFKMDIPTLQTIIKMDTKALYTWLQIFLKENGYEVKGDADNWIIGKPTHNPSRICLVSHIDTLRTPGKAVRLQMVQEYMVNLNGVLGADDRAGVFGICQVILHSEKKPYVIFTNYEESGGKGVKKLCNANAFGDYADDVDLFIELDRQDKDQYVYYSLDCPKSVRQFAEKYGYNENVGTYSDVADLTDTYMIPHLNLSIGYYNQHSKAEFLNVLEMYNTIYCVVDMVNDPEIPAEKIEFDYGWVYDNYISVYEAKKKGGGYQSWNTFNNGVKTATNNTTVPAQKQADGSILISGNSVGQGQDYNHGGASEIEEEIFDDDETSEAFIPNYVVVDGTKIYQADYEYWFGPGAWEVDYMSGTLMENAGQTLSPL
jgi:hypothetical protein